MLDKNATKSLFFFGTSETGKLAQSMDWDKHSLGPVSNWDPVLKSILSIIINSKFPMFIMWGSDRTFFYNDAYAPILASKHPQAFGNKFHEVWAEIWSDVELFVKEVDKGEAIYLEDLRLILHRKGFDEEAYFTFSYSPIFSPEGDVRGLYCACVETTERVFAVRELKESDERLNIALVSGKIGFWDLNAKTGHVNLSETLMTDWGINSSEFKNTLEECLEKIHSEDRDRVWSEIAKSTHLGLPYDVEYRVNKSSDEIIWVNARGRFDVDDDGEPFRLIGITANITERKQNEIRLKEALQTRDDFLSIASHELKTPISSIKMQIQMGLRDIDKEHGLTPSPEKLSKIFTITERQVNRLVALIDELLDITRIGVKKLNFNYERFNLADLAIEITERYEEEIKNANCSLHLNIDQNIVGSWDRLRMEQVITNLLSNAIKYGAGSKIELTLKRDEKNVLLMISDQGIGISKEAQSKIFGRFERGNLSKNISGLGLGLFITKEIVMALEGTIKVDSEVGLGSVFTIIIPVKEIS